MRTLLLALTLCSDRGPHLLGKISRRGNRYLPFCSCRLPMAHTEVREPKVQR